MKDKIFCYIFLCNQVLFLNNANFNFNMINLRIIKLQRLKLVEEHDQKEWSTFIT